jgi:hypothetical protein
MNAKHDFAKKKIMREPDRLYVVHGDRGGILEASMRSPGPDTWEEGRNQIVSKPPSWQEGYLL